MLHGKNFELACAQIGNRVEYAPTRTPRYKASIERWFWKQNRRLLHELPGRISDHLADPRRTGGNQTGNCKTATGGVE
jgi:hypothetical protein